MKQSAIRERASQALLLRPPNATCEIPACYSHYSGRRHQRRCARRAIGWEVTGRWVAALKSDDRRADQNAAEYAIGYSPLPVYMYTEAEILCPGPL